MWLMDEPNKRFIFWRGLFRCLWKIRALVAVTSLSGHKCKRSSQRQVCVAKHLVKTDFEVDGGGVVKQSCSTSHSGKAAAATAARLILLVDC